LKTPVSVEKHTFRQGCINELVARIMAQYISSHHRGESFLANQLMLKKSMNATRYNKGHLRISYTDKGKLCLFFQR